MILSDLPLSPSQTLVWAGAGRARILVSKLQNPPSVGQLRTITTEASWTWTEVSMGHKKFMDSTTATDPDETSLKTLVGQTEPAPVQMDLPPQGPAGSYAESVTWQPTPRAPPPLKKIDIAKEDV